MQIAQDNEHHLQPQIYDRVVEGQQLQQIRLNHQGALHYHQPGLQQQLEDPDGRQAQGEEEQQQQHNEEQNIELHGGLHQAHDEEEQRQQHNEEQNEGVGSQVQAEQIPVPPPGVGER